MASYTGTVVLSGMISPTDTTDNYPTHEDKLGKGGYMSVANLTDRDNISSLRRKIGMMVYVINTNTIFQLVSGIDNTNWIDFSSQISSSQSTTLVLSTIIVSGIITSIFSGMSIPNGEILYVVGDEDGIHTTINSGILATVLENNNTKMFIIVNNGTSSSVYVNDSVTISSVQSIIDSYPRNYVSINLVINPLSIRLKNFLNETYTDDLQIYGLQGVMSKVGKEQNTFYALNNEDDFVAIFDGINYSAYRKTDMTIQDLQSRLLIG